MPFWREPDIRAISPTAQTARMHLTLLALPETVCVRAGGGPCGMGRGTAPIATRIVLFLSSPARTRKKADYGA